MESNIIERTKQIVTPEMIDKVAASTGESPENTRKAIHGALPTILAGLAHRASTPENASSLTGTLQEGDTAQKVAGESEKPEVMQEGQKVVCKIFGDRSGSVTEALASHSGVKSSSASHILALAAPLIARAVGPDVLFGGAGGWVQALSSRKQAILEHPDAPHGLAEALGGERAPRVEGASTSVEPPRAPADRGTEEPSRRETPRQDPQRIEPRVEPRGEPRVEPKVERVERVVGVRTNEVRKHELESHPFEEREVRKPRRAHWGAVLAVGIAGLAAWGIFTSMRGHAPDLGVMEQQPNTPASAQPPAQPNPPAAHEETGIHLPNGKTLDVAPNSPEANFAHALADSSVSVPHRFRFDDLKFGSGSSAVPPDARKTIEHLGATLQAYPSSRVRVDGYTDDVGQEATNKSLSHARAEAIKQAIVSHGVAADRIDTTGSGPRPHVASNDSDQGRMQNRRSEIVLLTR
jgi:outer membrane protein OmpA-like peptidoglycan-associated protein